MMHCIFATDMARHMNDLNEIKAMFEEIPEGSPILPEGLTETEIENRRQKLIELTVHASDISFLIRPAEAQKM